MNYAILLAAGQSTRVKGPHKLFTLLGGKPLFAHALETFVDHPAIDEVILVVRASDKAKAKKWLKNQGISNVWIALGGATRGDSARNGVEKLGTLHAKDLLVFHNAANPFVTVEEIDAVIVAAGKTGAAGVAHPAADTLKRVDRHRRVIETLDRKKIWHAQTPQVVRVDLYEKVDALQTTDEMALAEAAGVSPQIIPAGPNNFKITTARDLEFAQFLLNSAAHHADTRHGLGMDSHRFGREHRGLSLGGIHLADAPRMQANSDGDVMLHALCNAILQALGEGSLSTVADDLLENHQTTNSRDYVNEILDRMHAKGFTLTHAGFQLEGAFPKIEPLSPQLKTALSELLSLSTESIGITATTGEDLTPFGRGEGLQCFATVTLHKK